MAFEYVDAPAEFKQYLKDIFTDEFMQAETNFKTFDGFQFSVRYLSTGNQELPMVYNKEVFLTVSLGKAQTFHHGKKWYVPQLTGQHQVFSYSNVCKRFALTFL